MDRENSRPKSLLSSMILAAILSQGCSREAPQPPAQTASPQAWTDRRELTVAEVATPAGEPLRLILRHEPAGGGSAGMRLILSRALVESELWAGVVDPAGRDRLWDARWGVALEPAPGARLAISTDGGARWRPGLPAADGWLFCPHVQAEGKAGAPDWAKLQDASRWAAQVLQTAVWGCDAAGACRSRALSGGPVHYSHGGEELLPKARLPELRSALALAERLKPDRALALALFDAAVQYQHGLDPRELERLGLLAARGLSEDGPLGSEERRALRLRLTLAREELKGSPPGQLSPRVSVEALSRELGAAQAN